MGPIKAPSKQLKASHIQMHVKCSKVVQHSVLCIVNTLDVQIIAVKYREEERTTKLN